MDTTVPALKQNAQPRALPMRRGRWVCGSASVLIYPQGKSGGAVLVTKLAQKSVSGGILPCHIYKAQSL